MPQVVATPHPVFFIPGKVGKEPRRDRHHIRQRLQILEIRGVHVGIRILGAPGPARPAEQTIYDPRCHGRLGSERGPTGDEEAAGDRLDLGPVLGASRAFERRDKGLSLIEVVGRVSTVLLDEGDHVGFRPVAVTRVIKGEKELEAETVGGRKRGSEGTRVGRVGIRHVEGECVDVRILRQKNIVLPVMGSIVGRVCDLHGQREQTTENTAECQP